MKYILLIHDDEQGWAKLSDARFLVQCIPGAESIKRAERAPDDRRGGNDVRRHHRQGLLHQHRRR